jgi:hypothetical protein
LPLPPTTTLEFTLQPFFERLGVVPPRGSATIPQELRAVIKQRIVEGEYFGVSAYVAALIEADQAVRQREVPER